MDAAATPSGAVAGTAASGVMLGMVEGRIGTPTRYD